jgi:hypothetical protein
MGLMGGLKDSIEARQADMPHDDAGFNDGQRLFRWLEIHNDSIPLNLIVDLGRLLGFRKQPRANSWILAGKAYLLGVMCNELFLDLHPQAGDEVVHFDDDDNDGGAGGGENYQHMLGQEPANIDGDEEVDQAVAGETVLHKWVSNAKTTNQLKLCVHHTWYTKYMGTNGSDGPKWSPTLMTTYCIFIAMPSRFSILKVNFLIVLVYCVVHPVFIPPLKALAILPLFAFICKKPFVKVVQLKV